MKRLLILFAILSVTSSCTTTKKIVKEGPIITFDTNPVDIGELTKGESHTLFFNFTNTGNQDLIIDLVTACKCTELDWPRKAIAPGEKGEIRVVFDSSTIDVGDIIKTVDIIANTDPLVVEAKFKANILAP